MNTSDSPYTPAGAGGEQDDLLDANCDTPRAALKHGWVVGNLIVSFLINLALNAGVGYGVYKGKVAIGLWSEPEIPDAVTTSMTVDLCATTFFVVWLTSVINAPGMLAQVKDGKKGILPISDSVLRRSMWRFFPVRVKGNCNRGLLLALELTVLMFGCLLLLLATTCASGGMKGGDGVTCYINVEGYNWLKGVYAGCCGVLAWAITLLGACNKAFLPNDVFEAWQERYKPVDNIE